MRTPHFSTRRSLPAAVRAAVAVLMIAAACGCGRPPATADVAASVSIEDAIGRPLSSGDALAAAAVVAGLPEDERPRFEPALSDVTIEGRGGRELAETYRRQFRSAINLPQQAERWRGRGPLADACRRAGLSTDTLALTLMQIGCAHHAAQAGRRVDLGDVRARTKTEIASLGDRIDAAPDLLTRRALADSLRAAVALDTYLTLLNNVPRESRDVVAQHRDQLAAVLPVRTAMEIVPRR